MPMLATMCLVALNVIAPQDDKAPAWIVDLMANFRSDGLLNTPDGLSSRSRPDSRYEMAVKVYVATQRSHEALKALRGQPSTVPAPSLALVQRQTARWGRLQRAATELRRELEALGVEYEPFTRQFSNLEVEFRRSLATRPFPDVPEGHWAAGAVGNLRSEGVILGYPAGKFKSTGN